VYYGINFKEIPFFFGVTLYSYDINGILTEIREEMKHPERFRKNLASSMLIVCVIYTLFGVCGYLAFGDSSKELITENLVDVVATIGIGIENAFYAL
jgi:proton-coupled amino acid transporter